MSCCDLKILKMYSIIFLIYFNKCLIFKCLKKFVKNRQNHTVVNNLCDLYFLSQYNENVKQKNII